MDHFVMDKTPCILYRFCSVFMPSGPRFVFPGTYLYTCLIDRFRFAEIMQESIPVLRKHIKEASMADLRVRQIIYTGWLS